MSLRSKRFTKTVALLVAFRGGLPPERTRKRGGQRRENGYQRKMMEKGRNIQTPIPLPRCPCEGELKPWVSSQFLPSIGGPGDGHIGDVDTNLFLVRR